MEEKEKDLSRRLAQLEQGQDVIGVLAQAQLTEKKKENGALGAKVTSMLIYLHALILKGEDMPMRLVEDLRNLWKKPQPILKPL